MAFRLLSPDRSKFCFAETFIGEFESKKNSNFFTMNLAVKFFRIFFTMNLIVNGFEFCLHWLWLWTSPGRPCARCFQNNVSTGLATQILTSFLESTRLDNKKDNNIYTPSKNGIRIGSRRLNTPVQENFFRHSLK